MIAKLRSYFVGVVADLSTPVITRTDFSLAFDPISSADISGGAFTNSGSMEPSVFDRTLGIITHDAAPYVRSIVAYDMRLQQNRLRLSNLLSEGGSGSSSDRRYKRLRTTRSAFSALEGGSRSSTRRERYFVAMNLNPYFVLRTGGEGWNTLRDGGSDAAAKDIASSTEAD